MNVNPHLFGPLSPEDAGQGETGGLFPGAERYLSARQRARGEALQALVAEAAGRLLEPGERVLYVAGGVQAPPTLDALGLGALANAYHFVGLVFTDRRLLEFLLDYKGKRLSTRTRSFPWSEVGRLKMGWLRLTLKPKAGKAHRWNISQGGDRKVLKRLVPKLAERALGVASPAAAALPTWHCPACARAVERKAPRCDACGTAFRSARTATWLALAFPGAGLFYAGHRWLGVFDLVGELIFYGVVAVNVAVATTRDDLVAAAGLAAFLLVGTKLESVHLARVLVARTKPTTPEAERGWRRLGLAGAAASVAAVLLLPAVHGGAANAIDHDLAFEATGWAGSFDREKWKYYGEDADARSEWAHDDGSVLAVMAFPLEPFGSFDAFRRDFEREIRSGGEGSVSPTAAGGFEGFRARQRRTAGDGTDLVALAYGLYDREGRDVHLVVWVVPAANAEPSARRLDALVAGASWVAPQSPQPGGGL